VAEQSKARKQLLLMFGIAFAALGIAYVLFYYAQSAGTWGTTNHGTFVQPATTARQLGVEGFETREKWWLWVVTPSCDDSACRDTLQQMRALHILLNRDADRVVRALLHTQEVTNEDEHLQLFPMPRGLEAGVYIVDPLGNLVLRYPLGTEPKPVLEDLKRLLKLSQIG
jgi:cytochrome oxidase Cu insertion factor (SCO1/SenC/PrrC family)